MDETGADEILCDKQAATWTAVWEDGDAEKKVQTFSRDWKVFHYTSCSRRENPGFRGMKQV